MRITGKKNIAAERVKARAAVDAVMLPQVYAAMGPKFALYQAKAHAAQENLTLTSTDDPKDILARFTALMRDVAKVETKRQALQHRIDTASTAAEIEAIIAAL